MLGCSARKFRKYLKDLVEEEGAEETGTFIPHCLDVPWLQSQDLMASMLVKSSL